MRAYDSAVLRRLVSIGSVIFTATSPAFAVDDFVTARALGMGEALRAGGSGATALYLNPATMASSQGQYVLELDYQNRHTDSTHIAGASIVDSTISYPLCAGVYYTFATREPAISGESYDASAHEVGLALAYAFGDVLAIGLTPLKYNNFDDVDLTAQPVDASSFTVDAGAVVKPFGGLSLGIAGMNLFNDPPLVRRKLGLGAGYAFGSVLLVEFDAQLDFDRREDVSPRYGGGGELFLGESFALRAGGIHESKEDATYVTGGLAYVAGAGGSLNSAAFELGFRQQIDAGNESLLSFAIRMFLAN